MTVTKNRSCIGKRRYTKAGARNAAGRQWRVAMVSVGPYRCRFCGGWHIGHRPRRRR